MSDRVFYVGAQDKQPEDPASVGSAVVRRPIAAAQNILKL
jgi:hypothetical protein